MTFGMHVCPSKDLCLRSPFCPMTMSHGTSFDSLLSKGEHQISFFYIRRAFFIHKNWTHPIQIRTSNLSIILVSTLPLGHRGLCNSGGRKYYCPRHLPHTVEMQSEASPYVVIVVLNKIQANLSGGFVVQWVSY